MQFHSVAMSSKINFIFQVSEILFNDWKLNFEEKTDIKDGTGVSHDVKIYIIYIPSYCNFSVDWSNCWFKY